MSPDDSWAATGFGERGPRNSATGQTDHTEGHEMSQLACSQCGGRGWVWSYPGTGTPGRPWVVTCPNCRGWKTVDKATRERLIERVMSEPIDFEVDAGHGWQKATATLDHEASGRMVDAVLSALPRLTEEERQMDESRAAALRSALSVSAHNIAHCPDHGLHGERTECFVCGGPVEQVPMVPLQAGAILPERITDEMVERAAQVIGHYSDAQFERWKTTMACQRWITLARAALEAALTIPSQPSE